MAVKLVSESETEGLTLVTAPAPEGGRTYGYPAGRAHEMRPEPRETAPPPRPTAPPRPIFPAREVMTVIEALLKILGLRMLLMVAFVALAWLGYLTVSEPTSIRIWAMGIWAVLAFLPIVALVGCKG